MYNHRLHKIKRNYFITYFFILLMLGLNSNANALNKISTKCHPLVNTGLPQFIIGYGSLMQEASKRETDPNVGPNFPIYVYGFKRGWIEKGAPIGFGTTY